MWKWCKTLKRLTLKLLNFSPFCLKIRKRSISRMLIPNPVLDFWNSDPKIYFWENLGPKIRSCPFYLKIGAHGISRMLILNPDLDFWNSDPKISFSANLGQKSQSCLFCLKVGIHGISRMLFLFQHLFSWFRTKNPFLVKFGPKKSNLPILPENWHTW